MALTIPNLNLESGICINNSYARVSTIGGDKNSLIINLCAYLDKEAFLDGKDFIKQSTFQFTPDVSDESNNFIKQAYDYLKTLPGYEDAVDC